MKNPLPLLISALIPLFFIGCSSSGSTTYTSLEKKKELDQMVAEGNFEIVAEAARPMVTNSLMSISNATFFPIGGSVARIDLATNANYFRVINDSVSIDLPYFGERQFSGNYDGRNSGIIFNGTPKEFKIDKNEKTQGYTLELVVKNEGEVYTINSELFPNHKSSISVTSTHRNPIGFDARISEYLTKE